MPHVKTRELPQTLQSALESVGYGRADIAVSAAETYSPCAGSGDGLRSFVIAVNLATGAMERRDGSWGGSNMFTRNAVDSDTKSYPLPEGFAAINGHIGGGKPVYATITVNPANLAKMLPSGNETTLDEREVKALQVVKGYKAGYRREYFEKEKLGRYDATNPLISGLAAKGMLKITGAGISITTEGRNAAEAAPRKVW